MVERIGTLPVVKTIPNQPIEEVKKREDFSWFNSTLSTTTKGQAYGANPDKVNDIIFAKDKFPHDATINAEMQARDRGEKVIPLVKSSHNVGSRENQLEKEQLEALEQYIKNRIEQIYNTTTHFKGKRVYEKYIRNQLLDLQKEISEHEKKSTLIKWFDKIFTGGLVLAGLGSLILTIATGGAALPTIIVFANAILAFGSGTTKIISAVNQHKADKKIGKLIVLGEDRKLLNNLSSEDIDELKDANDKEMQAHKLKKKEQEKKQETAKSMNNNRGG